MQVCQLRCDLTEATGAFSQFDTEQNYETICPYISEPNESIAINH